MRPFRWLIATAFLIPAHAMAQMPSSSPLPSITVTGRGEATGVPDIAVLILAVTQERKTAAEAAQATARTAAGVIEAVKGMGIGARDITTASLDLFPVYGRDNDQKGPQKVALYRATNRVTLRLRDMTQVGIVLDRAVSLGVNEVQGPSFSFDDPGKLQDEARRKAAAEAVRVARLYAEAMGVTLGPLRALSEEGSMPMPRGMPMLAARSAEAMAGAPPPVEPGEMDVSSSVVATFDIALPR